MRGEEKPRRVQLSRKKGWRMPENTVSVARPSTYGNPYRVQPGRSAVEAVAMFRRDWEEGANAGPGLFRALYATLLAKLRGKTSPAGARSTSPAMPTFCSISPTGATTMPDEVGIEAVGR